MKETLSKKEQALQRFAAHNGFLRCPVCGDDLSVMASGVCCGQKHSFDVARKGYVNLFLGQQKGLYDADLFRARQHVFRAGIFDPLVSLIANWIREQNYHSPFVLDAGCGEGSFLVRLYEHLGEATFLGVDISRDGIRQAASHCEPIMWCVADLANLPLATGSTDVILNVLSPANYSEFKRALRSGGRLIKVLPGEEYLQEIRQRLGGLAPYSNDEVVEKLEEKANVRRSSMLCYQVDVDLDLWQAMVQMTPLSQHRQVSGDLPTSVTIDLQIIEATLV